MAEYIERKEIIEVIDDLLRREKEHGFINSAEYALNFVKAIIEINIPAADVVPVIRCQNCKYKTSNGDVLYCRNRRGLTVIQNAKNYCNYGVTKDDENND